ncbi:MAG TPA: hypothetical protein VK999_02650 [Methylotenera sp.]|nr:hypothetical protein [Methylotenera sp.]
MTQACSDNRQTQEDLKGQLLAMNRWFADLEQRSDTINEALTLQHEEIDRVGSRFATLDAHAARVSESVVDSRESGFALKRRANSMNELTAHFRTSFNS